MSIQVNTGASAINWEALLSSLGDVEKTGNVDGRSEFTITTKVGDEMKTTTISIPDDLELPNDVDKGTLEALVDKLASTGIGFTDEQISTMKDSINELCEKATTAVDEVNKKSSGSAFFDLYALMALLIDVAQTQRDASRDMRTTENLAMQKAIQDQADIQRQAAKCAMIVGVVCGAISALGSMFTMTMQGINASSQSKIAAQSGADAAKMHSAALQKSADQVQAQTNFDNVSAKVGDEVATRVMDDFSAQLVDDQHGNLKTNLDTAVDNHNAAKTDLATKEQTLETEKATLADKTTAKNNANADYQDKSAKVEDKQAIVEQKQAAYDRAVRNEQTQNSMFGGNEGTNKVNAARAELETAKTELQTAKDAQAASKTTLDNATKELDDQSRVVANAQRDVGLANDKVSQTSTSLNKARTDYAKTVQDVAAQYEEKYQNAVDRLSNPEPGDNVTELEAKVKSARADMEMAFAAESKLLSEDNVLTQSEVKDIAKEARGKVDLTMDRVYKRADFKAAERKIALWAGINGINQAIGGVAQSAIQNWASMRSSEATRKGADTKQEEEMLDQTKDLFSQEQKLIDQVVQLFSAVIQAENQSMRDAIQA